MKKLIRGVKGVENIYTQENFPKFSVFFFKICGIRIRFSILCRSLLWNSKSTFLHSRASSKKSVKAKVILDWKHLEQILKRHWSVLKILRIDYVPNQHWICVGWIFFQSKDVIVFISGGVTYEESFHIYRLNKELQDQSRIVIGGNIIHNSRSFLNDILYHRNRSS